jgi:asparagine N-glycosylation enzyme membrane subunit Stt3
MSSPTPRAGEPAGIIGILTGLIAVLVALNVPGLTPGIGSLWVAVIVAVGGLIVAIRTRPVAPAVITAVIAAVVALVSGYGFHVSPGLVAAISGLVLAVLSVTATRPQVSPVGGVL